MVALQVWSVCLAQTVIAAATAPTSLLPVLGGTDVVAYQTLAASSPSILGTARFNATLTSTVRAAPDARALFWFASAANAAAFAADPWRYAPAYGGFCAYGVAFENSTASSGGWPWARTYVGPPGTPDVWRLYQNRLFIAFLPGALDGFFAHAESAIADADARWAAWWAPQASTTTAAAVAVTAAPRGFGVFNTQCLGPPKVWAKHSCSRTPQPVNGVPSISPLSAECIAAVDALCHAVSPAITGVIMGHACDDCLDTNSAAIIKRGHCPSDGKGDLDGIVDKVYCK
jgi:hypothetical protein